MGKKNSQKLQRQMKIILMEAEVLNTFCTILGVITGVAIFGVGVALVIMNIVLLLVLPIFVVLAVCSVGLSILFGAFIKAMLLCYIEIVTNVKYIGDCKEIEMKEKADEIATKIQEAKSSAESASMA